MTVGELIRYLREMGVELSTDGEQLRYSAPKGVLTPALRAELIERKAEILAAMRGGASASPAAWRAPRRADERRPVAYLERALPEHAPPYTRYVNPHLGYRLAQLNLDKQYVRGEGCYLYDTAGRRYLDFIAQYGAVPFGYNHPEIWRALEDVREHRSPSFVQPSVLTAAGELAERLIRAAPPGLRYVTFANSGAEAVEVAIKLCRSATGRNGILATENSFHGKTLGAVSATGRRMYQEAFGAPVAGFDHVPFGDVGALERALSGRSGYYAAFIVEPIQGEGGIVEPPHGYLAEVRRVCRDTGTLLVLDEVQTGLGRTGRLFACEHEGVSPDVLTLAKALGGGLIPIGACLCREEVYSAEFALRHSSTFAGNTLACRAGLAALDLLERDGRALVRQVADNGRALKQELLGLQQKYPEIIKAVRGRGYMLGVQFNLASERCRRGMLGYLAEHELFSSVLTSYLLNVEQIRTASPMSAPDVLRVEPPLVAGEEECRLFVQALDRTLGVVESGNTARLLGHLVGADVDAAPADVVAGASGSARRLGGQRGPGAGERDGRFAFLVHLNETGDLARFDPSLRALTEAQLVELKKRGMGFIAPSRYSEVLIESRTGQRAHGEFILVPYTARELVEMPYEQALSEVRRAVELAQKAGARIVGLGGFVSIVTQAGLALASDRRPALTTGNSYTVATGRQAVEAACRSRGRPLSGASVAVVGAAGALGRLTSMLLAEDASRVVLVGNPNYPERSRARLLDVAGRVVRHLWRCHREGHRSFPEGGLGGCLVSMAPNLPPDPTPGQCARIAEELEHRLGVIGITTDAGRALREADVVVTATSAVESFITAENLKEDAIVCELSRPFNVRPDVRRLRPDVLWIEGGLVRVPGEPDLGLDLGHEAGVVFACIAETMVLAFERAYQDTSLGTDLDVETIRTLEALAEKHGFAVVC